MNIFTLLDVRISVITAKNIWPNKVPFGTLEVQRA